VAEFFVVDLFENFCQKLTTFDPQIVAILAFFLYIVERRLRAKTTEYPAPSVGRCSNYWLPFRQ
jgi:hypothetical protein